MTTVTFLNVLIERDRKKTLFISLDVAPTDFSAGEEKGFCKYLYFLMIRPGECIFSGYVCDGVEDCRNGEDEPPHATCKDYEDDFVPFRFVKLVDKEVEKYRNKNIKACLRKCAVTREFVCRGVNHYPLENVCVLLESNIGMKGTLEQDLKWNFYERIETRVTCEEENKCRSGKCLNPTQFCDGIYDCPDKRDEAHCSQGSEVVIRLVDGRAAHEGRVEIRGYGHGWGGVCDDGWGQPEASVVCKMAGYRLGAKEATLQSAFGSSEGGIINLDEVDCTGAEQDILECKFNPWGNHDCSLKEFAGVKCVDEREECGEDEWRCKSGECKRVSSLCDGIDDCQDSSDEDDDQCDSKLAVRLVGGNNVTSGRLEIRNTGVWGTVCDDEFGVEEGSVVCKMLGLPGGVKIHNQAAYGEGKGPIWIKTIECNGTETSLKQCPGASWEHNYYCKHSEDVGLECLLTVDLEGPEPSDDGESGDDAGQCGTAAVEFKPPPPIAKVAGSQTAAPGSQPWTGSIRVRGQTRTFHWCGAVIISAHHVLTAAHCVTDYPKESYIVRVGDWDQDIDDVDEQEFSIKAVHFHPQYNVGAYLNNDIALIKIKESGGIRFTSRVSSACLPTVFTSYATGTSTTISGKFWRQ